MTKEVSPWQRVVQGSSVMLPVPRPPQHAANACKRTTYSTVTYSAQVPDLSDPHPIQSHLLGAEPIPTTQGPRP